MKKKALKILIPEIIVGILLIVGIFFAINSKLSLKPYEEGTLFTVQEGKYGKGVFKDLENQGIISSSDFAYYYISYFTDESMDFKAGSYLLETGMDLKQLVNTLCDTSKIYRPYSTIKIIEGETVEEIARSISETIDVDYEDLMNFWDDEAIVRSYMSDYSVLTEDIFTPGVRHYLEGYLFPNTYIMYNDSSLHEITSKLLDQTQEIYEKYKDDFANAPSYYNWQSGRNKQMSVHEIFTLASICQWESGNSSDMPTIAGVFYNRLNDSDKGSARLYSNVTACYAQGLYKKECTAVDASLELAYATEEDNQYYNTYNINDLPVGAICNPGESAIAAVLNPEETNYYYFVGYCETTYYSTKAQGNEILAQYASGC